MRLAHTDSIIQTLKEQGAVVLPRFFDEDFAEQMRAEAIALLTTPLEGVKARSLYLISPPILPRAFPRDH